MQQQIETFNKKNEKIKALNRICDGWSKLERQYGEPMCMPKLFLISAVTRKQKESSRVNVCQKKIKFVCAEQSETGRSLELHATRLCMDGYTNSVIIDNVTKHPKKQDTLMPAGNMGDSSPDVPRRSLPS
ncbi:hypothetical protein QR680_005706 [Steinernema hermaphroditum]|uniref:Uncharacterized protein n=1 Tax=Steinernema hermaphroditum TaxID=289476 RepID=A0AA39HT36_9BILA|nr:hypothetical protein QR680_005706 [Steinernema hermaphroditum]